jgi:hypothetical protein
MGDLKKMKIFTICGIYFFYASLQPKNPDQPGLNSLPSFIKIYLLPMQSITYTRGPGATLLT